MVGVRVRVVGVRACGSGTISACGKATTGGIISASASPASAWLGIGLGLGLGLGLGVGLGLGLGLGFALTKPPCLDASPIAIHTLCTHMLCIHTLTHWL